MNSLFEKSRLRIPANPWVRCALYLLVGYVGLLSMLLFFENWLVYHPARADHSWEPPPANAAIEDVFLTTADGLTVHAWWCPARKSERALLYCHGNAGNLSHRGRSIVKLRDRLELSVLIIDYPGYGKSGGSPSEAGCYAAGDAAYAWLTGNKNIAGKNIVLYGGSLGGGIATDLASRHDHRALVLIKTFTSMPDVASDLYWWLPAPKRMLMTNQFDNLSKIPSIRRPVFIAHGTTDRLIPHSHGEKLYEAANRPKHFHSMPGCDHNDPLSEECFVALKEFLRENSAD
jgi:hypothetical protein